MPARMVSKLVTDDEMHLPRGESPVEHGVPDEDGLARAKPDRIGVRSRRLIVHRLDPYRRVPRPFACLEALYRRRQLR